MRTRTRADGVITDLHGKPLSEKALKDLEKARWCGAHNDRASLRLLAIYSRISIRHLEEAYAEGREGARKVKPETP